MDFIIGDVRDKKSINYAMKGVDIVFHAAALKQVPSCEFFPDQAAATNIVGKVTWCSSQNCDVENTVIWL